MLKILWAGNQPSLTSGQSISHSMVCIHCMMMDMMPDSLCPISYTETRDAASAAGSSWLRVFNHAFLGRGPMSPMSLGNMASLYRDLLIGIYMQSKHQTVSSGNIWNHILSISDPPLNRGIQWQRDSCWLAFQATTFTRKRPWTTYTGSLLKMRKHCIMMDWKNLESTLDIVFDL